jgi:hypothetical protein
MYRNLVLIAAALAFAGWSGVAHSGERVGGAVRSHQSPNPTVPTSSPSWLPVVYWEYDKATKVSSLKVYGGELIKSGESREFKFVGLWRYDPKKKTWNKTDVRGDGPVTLKPVKRRDYSSKTDVVLMKLSDQIALYWAEWMEDGHTVTASVYAGPVTCEDAPLHPPPEGQVWACVPGPDYGLATSVPDPKIHCREPTPVHPANSQPPQSPAKPGQPR